MLVRSKYTMHSGCMRLVNVLWCVLYVFDSTVRSISLEVCWEAVKLRSVNFVLMLLTLRLRSHVT